MQKRSEQNEKTNEKIQSVSILKGGEKMGKSKMTSKAASRIQSRADKSGKNQGFKSRAQSAAVKNKK